MLVIIERKDNIHIANINSLWTLIFSAWAAARQSNPKKKRYPKSDLTMRRKS